MDVIATALTHPYLLAFGAALIIVGLLAMRWASRHDLAGLATDAAIKVAWNKGDLATETDLGNKLKALRDEQSNFNRAKAVAGYGVRHVVSRVVAIGGIIAIVVGLAMIVGAGFWKA